MGSTRLPYELAHWQPILDRLAEIPPDQLHEGTDLEFLFEFLEKRFGASTIPDCDEALEREHRQLNEISQQPGAHPALTFLIAIVTPHISHSIAGIVEEESPPLVVVVTLPSNFSRREDFGSVHASREGCSLELIPTADSTFEFRRMNLVGQGYSDVPFERPNVTGWKLEKDYPHYQFRYLKYFLTAPGGAVYVEVELKRETITDDQLEAIFDTLRVQSSSA